jgi:hypothetical protein
MDDNHMAIITTQMNVNKSKIIITITTMKKKTGGKEN